MFDDITTVTLTAAMRGASLRQTALAQNIANADTPGYKRVDVNFEGALADALEADRAEIARNRSAGQASSLGTHRRALDSVRTEVTRDTASTIRVDGSNVDPDNEMSELAANQLSYNTVTALLDARFSQMRAVIAGR
ncbi:MAG: flagellar basal body rod protein FlgB [Thermoleophilia bacterium]|nr:flagellar basal body rod protein FlgB [Thermoleophilia bacterium]